MTPVYAGKRVIGQVEDGVFRKSIQGSKHMLRKPPAIAFDLASLKQAEQVGASVVMVRDTETETEYRTTMQNIWRNGFAFNRGHRDQVALPLVMWAAKRS